MEPLTAKKVNKEVAINRGVSQLRLSNIEISKQVAERVFAVLIYSVHRNRFARRYQGNELVCLQ